MEDYLQIVKAEYLSNRWSDIPQMNQNKIQNALNEDDLR